VLGSGGARGWAHIGVIKAIREAGLEVTCVAGTSMGALVGAAFVSGRIDSLEQVAINLDWRQVLALMSDVSLPRAGLIDGRHVVDFVREHVLPGNIEDLPIPYAALATDIQTGEEVVLRRGPIPEAVRASIAIPGLFTPVCMGARVLVDGGLVNPLPVNVAREMGSDFVIAVDITRSPLPGKPSEPRHAVSCADQIRTSTQGFLERLNLRLPAVDWNALPAIFRGGSGPDQPNLFEIHGNMMRIFQRQITLTRLQLHPPDLLIQPDVQAISTMEFHRAEDAIKAGYTATRDAIARLDPLAGGQIRTTGPF
jgi:NTE family protein